MKTIDRRLTKLEKSKLGTPRYAGAVRVIVEEDQDAGQIIREKIATGEISPDALVIVRRIVSPRNRSLKLSVIDTTNQLTEWGDIRDDKSYQWAA